MVEILVAGGADVNAKGQFERTPLHWAAERGEAAIVERLLAAGATVNVADKNGKTPIEPSTDPHVIELLRRGASASARPTTMTKAAPATRPDKERELLRSIAGKWSGDAISTRGTAYSITYIFKEDGSFNISWRWGTNSNRGQYPPGTLRVIGSHFEHKNPDGRLWTITLHEDQKGRRILKGRRQDGNKWELKEQK